MNAKSQTRNSRRRIEAFSLIELLVVISIITILAGLLFIAMPAVSRARMMATARAELGQIMTAVEAYKQQYGMYPQDNPSNPTNSPLYYELTGSLIFQRNNQNWYRSLDGFYEVSATTVHNAFARAPGSPLLGIVNASTSVQATDERPAVQNFLKDLKPVQLGTNNGARVLVCSAAETPWSYMSTAPTNSGAPYELWVDVVTSGRTNRVASWNLTR